MPYLRPRFLLPIQAAANGGQMSQLNSQFLLLILIFCSPFSWGARDMALFHPYDDTFTEIVTSFESAQKSIDMALYNVDASDAHPIAQWLARPDVQARIQSGSLKVRLLFEGYEKAPGHEEKMQFFENLGVDVRQFGLEQKMHHKFAIIDGTTRAAKLITGSANWSFFSHDFYNENVVFLESAPETSQKFQKHFNLLWSLAEEYGRAVTYPKARFAKLESSDSGIQVRFNTDNYDLDNLDLEKLPESDGFVLTKKIVDAIDSAESEILIATTRIRLRPVYNAILRAVERGVKVSMVVSMQSYFHLNHRKEIELENCADEFERTCSTSYDFAPLLYQLDYPGKENFEIRVKYYNVKKDAYLSKQMHSKYMIVDQQTVYTGSFNWSYSAEYQHIENLLAIERSYSDDVYDGFRSDFDYLWNMGRDQYDSVVKGLEEAAQTKQKISCELPEMMLRYDEIDYLIDSGYRHGTSLFDLCH